MSGGGMRRLAAPGAVLSVALAVAAALAAAALAGVDLPFLGAGAPAGTAVVLAAGDIADCERRADERTARIVERHPDATVLTLGDNAYDDGTPAEFRDCYDPSWGRFKDRTRPVPGNHDYETDDAAGYFGYFGAAAAPPDGYYSFDLGAWHLVALNSECRRIGGCDLDDPQAAWLAADLARTSARCTLAFFHRPPFTSGRYGDDVRNLERMRVLWLVLARAGADVVLVGHEHSYERLAPMDATGRIDPEHGMRLFVVGTGGGNLRDFHTPPLPSTEVRSADTHGVLRLTLSPESYAWEFLSVAGGRFTDSGTGECH